MITFRNLLLFWLGFFSLSSFAEEESPTPKLKVAFVIDAIDTLKSGAVVSAHRFANMLRDHVDLRIISTGETGDDPSRVRLKGFYFPFAKDKMKRNGIKFAYPNKDVVREAFKDVDLVYVHFPFYLGFKAISWAKKMGKPVVVGFHLQPENVLHNIGIHYSGAVSRLYKMSINNFYNQADMVICPSEFSKGILTGFKTFTAKTTVISNGLTKDFRPNRKPKPEEYADKFLILTVGRLSQEKNHEVIINAIAESKYKDNIQLIATGDGALKEHLIKTAAKKEISAKFGYVSFAELVSLYNTADLYIHASEIELEGMSILEAIGTGLPAIISNSKESASKQFALNDDFLFENRDYKQLAKKIDYWYENQYLLSEKGKLYAQSAQKYYIENSVERMYQTFASAVKEHREKIDATAL